MTTLAAFVCCVMMMAEPVDPAAARQAAARFLQAKGAVLKNEAMQAPRRAMGQVADGQEASPYYVFNATSSKGFVVVSGDDCVGDNLVLGYTDQGSFDADNVPVNMQEWLDGIASQITSLSLLGVKSRAIALHDDVAPLLTSTWGQGKPVYDPKYPYNKLCPVVGGLLSCTGCMATAMSQVLYYHCWPQEPIVGDLVGYQMYTTKVDIDPLPSVKFDWDNMLDSYSLTATEEQQMAVATLMRYCGQVLQMDYTPSISNAYAIDLDVLINKFGIDQGVYLARSEQYSANDWDSLLYTELKEKRPLFHTGFSMGGGHAFILDGYEVQDNVGYYHVNWGWDGGSDGFYRLDVLNPYVSGTGGSSTSDGFAVSQQALIGFQPAKRPLENYGRYLDGFYWNGSFNNQPHCFAVINTSYMPVNFAYGMAERLADGTIDYDHILGEQIMETVGYSYSALQMDNSPIINVFLLPDHVADGLAPGSHRLVFVHKEIGTDAPWRPMFGTNCTVEIIVGDNGQPTDTIFHPQPKLSTTARSVKVVGLNGLDAMKMWGIQQTVEATVTNSSDDAFIGILYCRLYRVEDDILVDLSGIYQTALFIGANDKADVKFAIIPPTKGKYVAVLADDDVNMLGSKLSLIKNAEHYVGQKNVTANELTFYIQNFAYEVADAQNGEPSGRFKLTIGNNTEMDYNSNIIAMVYKLDNDEVYKLVVFPNGKDYMAVKVNVASNKRLETYLNLTKVLEPGNYFVDFYMASDYLGNKLSDYFTFTGYAFQVKEPTGIKAIDSDQPTTAGPWFSLDGRRLDSRPTAKGVYVRKGQKFVVR